MGCTGEFRTFTRLLHQKGQEEDADEGKENNLIILSKYAYYGGLRNRTIPYHEDILPRWEGTFTAYNINILGSFLFMFVSEWY